MTAVQASITIAVIVLGTFLTRALPFIAFPPGRQTPRYVLYLGRVLPFAITAMLIVYCLKDITPTAAPYALPELISIALVVALYLGFKNTLLAIAGGTVLYMVLVQLVF